MIAHTTRGFAQVPSCRVQLLARDVRLRDPSRHLILPEVLRNATHADRVAVAKSLPDYLDVVWCVCRPVSLRRWDIDGIDGVACVEIATARCPHACCPHACAGVSGWRDWRSLLDSGLYDPRCPSLRMSQVCVAGGSVSVVWCRACVRAFAFACVCVRVRACLCVWCVGVFCWSC